MSIGEMQACLARLYVDESFRRLFRLDPAATIEGYRLGDAESMALRNLDPRVLDHFARSLIGKRRRRMERAYPLLFAIDGREMRHYYARFYHVHPAQPYEDEHQTIIDFGLFMEESLPQVAHLPAYTAEVAKYERLYYAAALAARRDAAATAQEHEESVTPVGMSARPSLRGSVQVADFTYDIATIEEALQQGRAPAPGDVATEGSSILFLPGASDGAVRMLRINAPTKAVLDLCDGSRTMAQIVADSQAALHAADLRAGIVAAVSRLLASGVLTLDAVDRERDDPAPRRSYGGDSQIESL